MTIAFAWRKLPFLRNGGWFCGAKSPSLRWRKPQNAFERFIFQTYYLRFDRNSISCQGSCAFLPIFCRSIWNCGTEKPIKKKERTSWPEKETGSCRIQSNSYGTEYPVKKTIQTGNREKWISGHPKTAHRFGAFEIKNFVSKSLNAQSVPALWVSFFAKTARRRITLNSSGYPLEIPIIFLFELEFVVLQ